MKILLLIVILLSAANANAGREDCNSDTFQDDLADLKTVVDTTLGLTFDTLLSSTNELISSLSPFASRLKDIMCRYGEVAERVDEVTSHEEMLISRCIMEDYGRANGDLRLGECIFDVYPELRTLESEAMMEEVAPVILSALVDFFDSRMRVVYYLKRMAVGQAI